MRAIPYRQFMHEVIRLYNPPHRRKATQKKMRKVLEEVAAIPDVRKTSDITPTLIVRWLDAHADRRPITNRSYLSSFRAAVNYARKMGYLKVSPWDVRRDWITPGELEGDEDEDPSIRHLSIAEMVKLLDLADAEAKAGGWLDWRRQALVYTYSFTGMRKCEALGLKASDVDLEAGLIILRGRKRRRLKTLGSKRRIAVHPELATILGRWLPRCDSEWLFPGRRKKGPWLEGSRGQKALDEVKALGVRSGVENLTIQSFRRSIATHAKLFGLGPLAVKDLLGHSSERTQEWYLEDDLANMRDAIHRIDYRRAQRDVRDPSKVDPRVPGSSAEGTPRAGRKHRPDCPHSRFAGRKTRRPVVNRAASAGEI